MLVERAPEIKRSLPSPGDIEVDVTLLSQIVREKGGSLASFPEAVPALAENLRILACATASKTDDYEEIANSLGYKFDISTFNSSIKALYDVFRVRAIYHRPFELLRKTMEEEIIPKFTLLTPRQWEALGLLALGLGNPEIGEKMNISWHTAKTHSSAITSELGGDRTVSAIIAMQNGWVDVADLKERLGNRSTEELKEQFGDLLSREKEVAAIVGNEGLTDKKIAWRLSISEQTVKNYVVKILKKLNLRNRTEIAIFFFLGGDELDEEKMTQPKVATPTPVPARPAIKEELVKKKGKKREKKKGPPPTRRRKRRKKTKEEIEKDREKRREKRRRKREEKRILEKRRILLIKIWELSKKKLTPEQIEEEFEEEIEDIIQIGKEIEDIILESF